jgi:hypothetical protein
MYDIVEENSGNKKEPEVHSSNDDDEEVKIEI